MVPAAVNTAAAPLLHRGPFLVRDAEADAVANAPRCANHVVAKKTFLGRAQAGEGGTGPGIERGGHELDLQAVPSFEGVFEHQKLGLGIRG